ncbi:hypothetical protein BO78DRAFT_8449 [Aspergillus sclerotiicarbonarius CBS 121057]|uniref:Uncharacterized protein n=1 Tax=Aspergillus sclerotiicarbonarius (strain CBS 121057 / IBT 28362) TaxID=1448318 RepID=A0A319ESG6_ASPSB|nr:hypothetical protein BO78DRAFT_8449 [Aspergillus sclerotiicarbonarius CBS 121057]
MLGRLRPGDWRAGDAYCLEASPTVASNFGRKFICAEAGGPKNYSPRGVVTGYFNHGHASLDPERLFSPPRRHPHHHRIPSSNLTLHPDPPLLGCSGSNLPWFGSFAASPLPFHPRRMRRPDPWLLPCQSDLWVGCSTLFPIIWDAWVHSARPKVQCNGALIPSH